MILLFDHEVTGWVNLAVSLHIFSYKNKPIEDERRKNYGSKND